MPRALLALALLLAYSAIALAEDGIGFGRAAPTPRQNAILTGVIQVVRRLDRQGEKPVCVFDLDATLFEAGCRHRAIFAEFAAANRARYPRMAAQVAAWVPDDLPYSVQDMIARLGVTDPSERDRLMAFWKKRFFSNEYLRHDHPIRDSVPYVNLLSRSGATIVYLTGRNESKQLKGSLETLSAAGFPLGPGRGVLLMSSKSGVRDDVWKGSPEVRKTIADLGTIVAIFDNEPGNCNHLQKSFPGALTVRLDTNHSPGAPGLDPGIPLIANYRSQWLTEELRSSR